VSSPSARGPWSSVWAASSKPIRATVPKGVLPAIGRTTLLPFRVLTTQDMRGPGMTASSCTGAGGPIGSSSWEPAPAALLDTGVAIPSRSSVEGGE
jgi:hypothetical protein